MNNRLFRFSLIWLVLLGLPKVSHAQNNLSFPLGNSIGDLNRTLRHAKAELGRYYDSTQSTSEELGLSRPKRGWPNYYDSLSYLSDSLSSYLKKTIPRIPNILNFNTEIDKQNSFIWIARSADHKIAIWTWDTYLGGTMPIYEYLFVYQTDSGIKAISPESDLEWNQESNGLDWFDDTIFSVHAKNGSIIYLPRGIWKADTRHGGVQLGAYTIQGNSLNTDQKIFPAHGGFESEFVRGDNECPVPELKVVKSKLLVQRIKEVPLPKGFKDYENFIGKLTSKFDEYEFDSEHFVYKGVSK